MKEKLGTKAVGFYFIVLAALLGIISVIRFVMWGSAHDALDTVTIIALIVAIVFDIILMVKDNDYLVIAATACYSIATVKLLTDSVGSFVDAFQGINMFGDASQVGTIISISAVMGVSILLSIISGFLKRVKES
ncbi:MAG TPA: hypothetical protein H9756_12115 [Candidatus Mediterraneibacter gallistercoris]|uniref:Uncharacterized protein n=1 Tax=Candidatus Mediterraneibacter gallistercoris TaxID=2838671 RepID=A0A9D2P6P6_9FIRM|nr:hypothetical protein [Candidatus Mediterraneibacter gallistercoris]